MPFQQRRLQDASAGSTAISALLKQAGFPSNFRHLPTGLQRVCRRKFEAQDKLKEF